MRYTTRILLLTLLPVALLVPQARQPALMFDKDPVVKDSESAACDIVKNHVAERELKTKKPDRYWFCDFSTTANEYFRIAALRSSAPRADGATIYSNMVSGWYAVARRGHVMLLWDLNEDRLVQERTIREDGSGPVVEDSPETACEVLKTSIA